MTVGETIKYWRTEKGITQKKLAEKSGVSEISIRKYEADARTPKIGTLRKIAKALDINVSDIDKRLLLDNLHQTDQKLNQQREELFKREQETGQTFNDELYELNVKSSDVLSAIITLEDEIKNDAIVKYKNNKILSSFNQLNSKGQNKAIEQVELLTKIPEYRKDTE